MLVKPIKAPKLEARVVGAEVLVHDAVNGKIHVLNASAGRVLELCDGRRTPSAIAIVIAEAAGADLATVEPDVAAILGQFATLGILEAV